jgi:aminopeptidase N
VFLTVPRNRKAGSTGTLTKIAAVGDSRVQYQWKTRYPIAFYLISFAVADYQDYSFHVGLNAGDSLLVKNYIYNRPGYLESTKAEIDRTASFLKLYSKLFGPYPFMKEKYGHCVAPIGGGMEHQTMTTLNNFGYTLVSHELAHQWFGDHTTCATWQDIWVNEGFASYAEYLAYENLNSKMEADAWMNNAQSRALREPEGSVFVPSAGATDENRIFSTNLSYKKGAVILHMLRKQINNDTLFFRSLRSYLSKYTYGSASGDDFKQVVEQETGTNLQKFFDQWYYGKGYPVFDISWMTSRDSLFLNVNQTGSSAGTPFFSTPFDVRATGKDLDTTFRLEMTSGSQLFKIKLSKPVSSIEFDPDHWLLKTVQSISKLPEMPSNDNYFDVKPNPFNNQLILTFRSESAEDEKIEIIDLSGRAVYKTLIKSKKETTINTSWITPGSYLLVVSHGNEKYVRKIFKANVY